MTSAAEAKLDARIRPDIAVMRSRTPYPKRHPPASASAGEAGHVPSSSSVEGGANAATGQSASAALAAVADDTVAGDTVAGDAVAGDTVAPDLTRPDVVKLDAGPQGAGQSAGVRAGAAAPAVGRPLVARPRSARPVTSGAAARPTPIRLTRRGRVVIGILVAIVA